MELHRVKLLVCDGSIYRTQLCINNLTLYSFQMKLVFNKHLMQIRKVSHYTYSSFRVYFRARCLSVGASTKVDASVLEQNFPVRLFPWWNRVGRWMPMTLLQKFTKRSLGTLLVRQTKFLLLFWHGKVLFGEWISRRIRFYVSSLRWICLFMYNRIAVNKNKHNNIRYSTLLLPMEYFN